MFHNIDFHYTGAWQGESQFYLSVQMIMWGLTTFSDSSKSFVGYHVVFSKKIVELLWVFGKCKFGKFWAATNKKQVNK